MDKYRANNLNGRTAKQQYKMALRGARAIRRYTRMCKEKNHNRWVAGIWAKLAAQSLRDENTYWDKTITAAVRKTLGGNR